MKPLLWLATAVMIGAYITTPLIDPDLWWHIAIGRWIVAHGWVPYVEHWNAFAAGKPWVAYSWSQEVVFALIDSISGLHGLLAFKLLLFIVVSLTFCFTFSYIARDWFFGLMIGLVAVGSLCGFVLLRPQTFVWIYSALQICILTRIVRRQEADWYDHIGLVVVMSLWANAHITTALGMFICVTWLFQRVPFKLLLIVAAVCFAGTLITPYGGREWIVFLSKTDHPLAHANIVEFGAAHIRDYGTGMFIILLSLLIIFGSKRPASMSLGQMVAVGVFSVGGLGVVKFMPFAVLVLGATLADVWSQERQKLGNIYEAFVKLEEQMSKYYGQGLLFFIVVLSIVYGSAPFKVLIEKGYVADGALDFMLEKDLPYPVMNAFGEGGYVMYRYTDAAGNLERKVSIDGRTNVNPELISTDNGAAYSGNLAWRTYFEQVTPETVVWKNPSPLTSLLVLDPQWCRVYCDGEPDKGYSVFVKRSYFESKPFTYWAKDYCPDTETTCGKPEGDGLS